jgi:class 3 adenylate cyclase
MVKDGIIKKVLGSIHVNELDHRIYNIMLLILIPTGLLIAIGNVLEGLNIITIIDPIFVSTFLIILYYLSIRKHLYFNFLFCFAAIFFNAVQWIYNGGGSSGGIQYFFMWTFILATILLRGKKLIICIIMNCVVLLGLLLYEYFDGSLIVQYADNTTRLIDIIVSASFSFVLISFLVRVIYAEINKERQKTEKLLLNILPQKVVNELKEKGNTNPEIFKNVTVLFSDIVGFTDTATRIPVETLIKELNDIFTTFDTIIEKHACERIKTIGDAYLAVCGLPESNENHCKNVVNAALEMMSSIKKRNMVNGIKWQIRIGVHTGQVIGSVVGIKKYIYDVFGDTVNTASRLESLSKPMKINISIDVMNELGNKYNFEDRGKIEVKGKNKMEMYFVNSIALG